MTTIVRAWGRLDAWGRKRAVALAWAATLAISFLSPLWRAPLALGHGDWLWFHFAWDAARRSLVSFGEPLYWNAYYCGGSFGLANPQSFALAPALWLFAPLPTAVGLKAFLTTCVFLGAWGTWELARLLFPRGSGVGALVAAATFACCGSLGWHLNGQLAMANMELYPWVFWLLVQGRDRPSRGYAAGALLGVMLLDNGTYPAVLGCVGVGVFTAASMVAERATPASRWPTLRSAALAAIAMPATSAIMLLPLADVLRDHQRPVPIDDAIPLAFVPRMLLEKHTTETQIFAHGPFELVYGWWGEYGNYVGYLGLALLIAAFACARRVSRERLTAAALFALLLGDHGVFSPFGLFRRLPLLGSLRVPTRYWPLLSLFGALVLSAFVHQTILRLRRLARPRQRELGVACLLGVLAFFVVDLVRTNGIAVHAGAMVSPPAPRDEPFEAFHQVLGRAWPMTDYPPRNQGTLRCFDELRVAPASGLQADLPSEVYLADPTAGTVRIERWTPSEVVIEADVTRPTVAVYNQTFYRGWRAEGAPLVNPRGLIGARLGVGRSRVRWVFRPVGFSVGAAITAASMLALWALWRRDGRRQG